MKIKKIDFLNFRKHKKLEISFSPGINVVIGENACGKTSVLEGIGILSTTKSFKKAKDEDMVSFGAEYYYIQTIIEKDGLCQELAVSFSQDGKKLFKNKKKVNPFSEYLENLKAVIFSNFDFELVNGSPSARRKFLNLLSVQYNKKYAGVLNEYEKILKERNFLLKRSFLGIAQNDKKLLDVLTTQLIEKGKEIIKLRGSIIDTLNSLISLEFVSLIGNKENLLSLKYIPCVEVAMYEAEMSKALEIDIAKGATQIGPHRDDYCFLLNDKNLEFHGSQGQQRDALISLKLAVVKTLYKKNNDWPVLLLDDVFSELDPIRQNNILKSINDDIQTIITTTSLTDIKQHVLENINVIKL